MEAVVVAGDHLQTEIQLGRGVDDDLSFARSSHAATTSGGAAVASVTHSATERVSARRVGSTPDAVSQSAMPGLGSWRTSAMELATCLRFWRKPALTSLKNNGC